MTKFLRSALGANEPTFSQSIRQLEHAAGLPSADIRLTSEITQKLRTKIAQLGLDPSDTTGPELYAVLHQKLEKDEQAVRTALNIASDAPAEIVVNRVRLFLEQYEMPKSCFAIKPSVVKRLLKKKPPKMAMKRLGYRSTDSMLKHESAGQLLAAAAMTESSAWHKSFREQYARLAPSDFESRTLTIVAPQGKHWQELGRLFATQQKQLILGFKELGTVVLLPSEETVDGLAITTLSLVMEELNQIRAYSSFAKLQQVKPDFGKIIQSWCTTEPVTSALIAGQPVPWRMIQRYYGRFGGAYHPEVFEPHVQPEDLAWHHGEDVLATLSPTLKYWQDTQFLVLLHQDEPVSLNLLDVALGYCNHLAFAQRIVHFVRDNLWHELMMRYLHQQNLEDAVHAQLSKELTPANNPLALAEQDVYNEA